MNVSSRKAVFARLGSRPIPRVARMMRVAAELRYEPEFCGARREEGLPRTDQWETFPVVRLGRTFPLLNGRRPLTYLSAVLSYNASLLRHLLRERPPLVHASDIETMPACMLYRMFSRTRLVYNIHDNVAQRYRVPRLAEWLLNAAEGLCVVGASITVVPEEFRREALPSWCRRRVAIVRNTPQNIAYEPPLPAVDGRVRIFFGGWLDWGRGLRALLQIAECHPRIDLRIAGEGSPEIVAHLKAHPRVTFLGFLDHDAVMRETAASHVIPALYDPARKINRFAASNKLAEALAVGRVLLINSEMAIADSLAGHRCVVSGPYGSAVDLCTKLLQLVDNWPAYQEACRDARSIYESRYAWEPVRRACVAAICGASVT